MGRNGKFGFANKTAVDNLASHGHCTRHFIDSLKAGILELGNFLFIALVFVYVELEDLNCKRSPGAPKSSDRLTGLVKYLLCFLSIM